MKNKNSTDENYLDKIPVRASLDFDTDEKGMITLHVENKGAVNKVFQVLFKKPKISYIHLEENGSFIWQQIDGERDVYSIGELLKERFGEKAEPLYERLTQYLRTMEMYHFISFKE